MSSKSRKHSSPPPRSAKSVAEHGDPAHATPTAAQGEIEHAEPSHKDFLEAEELLRTPKGQSPLVFAGLVLLLVFLMLVFLLPPSVFDGQGGGGNQVMMRWVSPTRGPVEVRSNEFFAKARSFAGLMSFFGQRSNLYHSELARFLILDDLALENGITFSDEELRTELGNYARQLGGTRNLEARLGRYPGGIAGFQETLRAFQRINRYQNLLGKLQSLPDPSEIEKQWNEQFLEWAFDYVYADSADFLDEARAEAPDDATLETWFAARPEFERAEYMAPEKFDAKVMGVLFDSQSSPSATGAELLAAYPLPEDWDEEARADAYYKRYYFTRYRKPVDTESGAVPDPENLYAPFEEVRDQAALEAKLLEALQALQADLAARKQAGEELDFAAEAERLGLDLLADGQARSIDEWRQVEGLDGQFTGAQMFGLQAAGDISSAPAVTEDALVLVQLDERLASELPEFGSIREQVLEQWVSARATELANEALESLRAESVADDQPSEAEPETPAASDATPTASAEQFASVARERGFEVKRRDWLLRSAKQQDDPNWNDPANTFLRTRYDLYQMKADQLSEVLPAMDKQGAYLVRVVGSREVPIEQMEPGQYQSLLDQVSMRQSFEFAGGGPISLEDLRENYGLWLQSEQDKADEGAADVEG